MDKYFRAVGFSHLQAGKQLDTLIQTSFRTCESKYTTGFDSGDVILDCFKYFGKGIGLGLSGKINKNKSVVLHKCFPFAESSCRVGAANAEIEHVNNDRLMLFYDKKTFNQFVVKLQKTASLPEKITKLSITALSAKGKVLLPLVSDKQQVKIKKRDSKNIKRLLQKTCGGDTKAGKKLEETLEQASQAIRCNMITDDFFSVVDSYFQPDDESEFAYDILADIIDVETITNSMTDEKLHSMTLDVAGTKLQLYINHNDLIGMPSKGMRFWGVCVLYGSVVKNNGIIKRLARIFSYR